MKTTTSFILIPAMILCLQVVNAQEFSFKMYFQDSAGHQDTLTLGYDVNGTDGIDPQFGEVNIIDVPLNRNLDVRISDEWSRRYDGQVGTWHTKTQIVQKRECGLLFPVNNIDIFTNHWPVTISWDSSLFTNPCLEASLFTSVMPYGWWDTGGFLCLLPLQDTYSFLPNEDVFSEYYGYVNSNNDTINVFWQTLGDSALIMSSKFKDKAPLVKITLFPNPANTLINFRTETDDNILSGQIISARGEIIQEFGRQTYANVSNIKPGVYVLKLFLETGKTATTRFIVK